MGFTKNTVHTFEQNQIAKIFKSLGHPARVAILEFISSNSGCICNDIVNDMDLAQATISQHLSELKKLGLLKTEFQGKKTCYHIDLDRWYELKSIINDYFVETQKNFN